jgi:hypothetical protein
MNFSPKKPRGLLHIAHCFHHKKTFGFEFFLGGKFAQKSLKYLNIQLSTSIEILT